MSEVSENLRDRIWKGDKTTVQEAIERWDAGEITLIALMSTLYSFRSVSQNRDILHELLPDMKSEVERLTTSAFELDEYQQVADEADVLSTILAWMGEDGLAEKICDTGLTYSTHLNLKKPSRTLLLLTCTDLNIRKGNLIHALRSLREAERVVGVIEDPNQRNRAYRKIGILYRKFGFKHLPRSLKWGLCAVCMRDITHAVRMKSVAALFI